MFSTSSKSYIIGPKSDQIIMSVLMALFVPTSCNMTVHKTVSNSTRKWLFLLNFFLYNTPNGKKKVSFCECMCSVVVLNLSDIFLLKNF